MKKEDFAELLQSVKEAKAILRGEMKPAREMTLTAAEVRRIRAGQGQGAFLAAKVRSIRKRLRLSQGQFAVMLRVSKATLQNWEQGRRKPEGPALALLLVTDRAPETVLAALHGKIA